MTGAVNGERPGIPDFVRTFIAVDVAPSVRDELASVQEFLKKSRSDVAWVRPDSIHLSLLFLGDVASARVSVLADVLDCVGISFSPMIVTAAGVGTFGPPRRPRVVWAGVQPCEPLIRLQGQVASEIGVLGIAAESRAYHPHLTLGRVRSSRGADDLQKALAATAGRAFGQSRITDLVLYRSRLLPQGAEYSPLHRASFSASEARPA
jgi:RNA 2',3'-cyclic 3'-phosphodiesterase